MVVCGCGRRRGVTRRAVLITYAPYSLSTLRNGRPGRISTIADGYPRLSWNCTPPACSTAAISLVHPRIHIHEGPSSSGLFPASSLRKLSPARRTDCHEPCYADQGTLEFSHASDRRLGCVSLQKSSVRAPVSSTALN